MPTKPHATKKETKAPAKKPAKKKVEEHKKKIVRKTKAVAKPLAEELKTTVAPPAPIEAAEIPASAILPVETGQAIQALGRRKTAIARVRLITNGSGKLVANGKPADSYFSTFEQRLVIRSPLKAVGMETAMDVYARVIGGGMHAQSEAVRLGIARALVELNPTYRKTLKKLGFLTRDPRAKERKKPGLKRARRAPQWSKR